MTTPSPSESDATRPGGQEETKRTAGNRKAPTVTRLRTVAWCNLWNVIAANNGDGYGSKYHLTESEGVTGKTLCGKRFPDYKGHPSCWEYCRRCVRIARGKGYEQGFTRGLRGVPSVGSL